VHVLIKPPASSNMSGMSQSVHSWRIVLSQMAYESRPSLDAALRMDAVMSTMSFGGGELGLKPWQKSH